MTEPYKLNSHLCRFCTFYAQGDSKIPAALFDYKNEKPDLTDFPLPLPSKKSDYTCFEKTGNIEAYLLYRALDQKENQKGNDMQSEGYPSADQQYRR